jgi:hypothetical protein
MTWRARWYRSFGSCLRGVQELPIGVAQGLHAEQSAASRHSAPLRVGGVSEPPGYLRIHDDHLNSGLREPQRDVPTSCVRQSIRSAWPSRQRAAANWSMIPQGTPRTRSPPCVPGGNVLRQRFDRAPAVSAPATATSIAAEDDRPAPEARLLRWRYPPLWTLGPTSSVPRRPTDVVPPSASPATTARSNRRTHL